MSYEKVKEETYAILGGINSKVSPYVNGPLEFRDLSNVNFFNPGSLTKRQGTTLYTGATISGRITGLYEFDRLSGASYLIVTANTTAYNASTSSFSAFKTGLLNNAIFDFITFTDRLFGCNGQDFFKYDGTNAYSFSLPPPPSFGVTAQVGGSLTAGVTGVFLVSYGYMNERGFRGPGATGMTVVVNGVTTNSILYYGMTLNYAGYGITAIQLYRSSASSLDTVSTTLIPSSGATFLDSGLPLGTITEPTSLWFTAVPKYLEIYNNQVFMAGFSNALSTVYWSEIGNAEDIQPEYFAEFRTNDGDKITGLKAYQGNLVVTKEKSTHRVSGDNPTNLSLQEVSDQYGCISNRCMVAYESKLWFLDRKGIVEYNGANIGIVSDKVEPIFLAMNTEAAKENAVGIHYKKFNELWFAIPINGATMNNCIVVFDYLTNAWTKYEGLNISSLNLSQMNLSELTPFYGGYTGNLFNFGASYTSDFGNAITCLVSTKFLAQEGQTTERMYRRFYLNIDPVLGVTSAISVNFKTNYSSSYALTRTMYQTPYQSRLDFGLSSRSIQAEISHVSASLPFKINGFTFESRFQRSV